jgi:hypothetical protein
VSPDFNGGDTLQIIETTSELEPLLSTSDVARITGRSVSTLEKDRLFGTGPAFVKIGRLVKYRPCDLREWLQSFEPVRSTFEAREGR